jgi:phosphatidylserine/phosphatidylglycerophosphate/cardiolipin synthase-like enzyme
LEESLTGLNEHVEFLHTKFMLIDPLTDDPITIAGSANFSAPSTTKNDENMLVIRGSKRVADIYLGEFMRMFNHFHGRNVDNVRASESHLAANDSWTAPYYEPGTQEWNERLLFR